MKHFDLNCGVLFYHYNVLEIKTFGLVLEFKTSFQQQQHSIAFNLSYSHWDVSFLLLERRVITLVSQNLCLVHLHIPETDLNLPQSLRLTGPILKKC